MYNVDTPFPVRVAARLTRLANTSTDAQQVSDAIVSVLRDMDTSLSPIIGRPSLLALMNRSVALADATNPWLDINHEADDVETTLAALRGALPRHGPSRAAACGAAVVAGLHGSLTALIGQSLAERLLHNVARTPQDDPP
jgi:hypothetical protein